MDVCKKLELNTLRFDRDMKVSSLKRIPFLPLQRKNTVDLRVFKIFSEITLIDMVSQKLPLFYMWVNIATRGQNEEVREISYHKNVIKK